MKPGCPGLPNEGQKSARGWGRAISLRDGWAEGKANCWRERQADTLYTSNTSSIKPNISACSSSRVHMEPGRPSLLGDSTRSQLQHTAQPPASGCQGLRNSCCFPGWRNSHFRGGVTAPTHVHFTFKSSGLRGVSETEGDIIAIKKRPFPSASGKNERHHQRYGSGKQSLAKG